jgi:hypothetical protein
LINLMILLRLRHYANFSLIQRPIYAQMY